MICNNVNHSRAQSLQSVVALFQSLVCRRKWIGQVVVQALGIKKIFFLIIVALQLFQIHSSRFFVVLNVMS